MSSASNTGHDSRTSENLHSGTSPNQAAGGVDQEESKILEADPAQRDSAFDSHHMPAQPLPCGIKNSESHWRFRREQQEKVKKNFEDHKEQVPIGGKRVMREGPQQQSEMFNAPRVMGQAAPNDISQTF